MSGPPPFKGYRTVACACVLGARRRVGELLDSSGLLEYKNRFGVPTLRGKTEGGAAFVVFRLHVRAASEQGAHHIVVAEPRCFNQRSAAALVSRVRVDAGRREQYLDGLGVAFAHSPKHRNGLRVLRRSRLIRSGLIRSATGERKR